MRDTCASGHYIVNYYAALFDAAVLCIEHRFYGATQPFGDLSTPHLKYLSAQQALADFAVVSKDIRSRLGAGKVIAFGGSYSGNLAAWFRLRYPELVFGALASSAPVKAVVNFPEYLAVVGRSLDVHPAVSATSCGSTVHSAFVDLQRALTTQQGRTWVLEAYEPCTDLESDLDQVTFIEALADTISGFVQYNRDNNGAYPYDVEELCKKLQSGPAREAVPKFFVEWNTAQGAKCIDSDYKADLEALRTAGPSSPLAASRAWFYQTCSEFGYYQTTDSSIQPFGDRIKLQYFLDMCLDLFGIDAGAVKSAVAATNVRYGSVSPNVTRVVFTNGIIDPWHVLGVSKGNAARDIAVHVMASTAHCADLYMPTPRDPPELTATRAATAATIKRWLEME